MEDETEKKVLVFAPEEIAPSNGPEPATPPPQPTSENIGVTLEVGLDGTSGRPCVIMSSSEGRIPLVLSPASFLAFAAGVNETAAKVIKNLMALLGS